MKVRVISSASSHLAAIRELFEWAEHVDMAYAWAGSENGKAPHWKAMRLEKVGLAVIGTAFAQTEPHVLRVLDEQKGRLKLQINVIGTFHPKVLLAKKGNQARAIVGSANFTKAAYSNNTELSVLLSGDAKDRELKEIQSFISNQWKLGVSIESMPPGWLDRYTEVWNVESRRKVVIPGAKLELVSMSSLEMTWEKYLQYIYAQEGRSLANGNKVTIFGKHPSYFHEIDKAAKIFSAQPTFSRIPSEDRKFLMGVGESSGFLGNMRAAGYAKEIVNDTPSRIGAALDLIPLHGDVPSALIEKVLNRLTSLKGVQIGVASRLLVAKRPDIFVSVNNGSKPQLSQLIGVKNIQSVKQYMALLQRVWSTQWYRSPEPQTKRERSVWRSRAALLDAALYEQV